MGPSGSYASFLSLNGFLGRKAFRPKEAQVGKKSFQADSDSFQIDSGYIQIVIGRGPILIVKAVFRPSREPFHTDLVVRSGSKGPGAFIMTATLQDRQTWTCQAERGPKSRGLACNVLLV